MPNGNIPRQWKKKLCGASEIADFANVQTSQVAHWRKTDWFPKPIDEPRMGSIWDYKEVTKALSARGYPKELSYTERYPANRKRRKQQPEEDGHGGSAGDGTV